MDHFFSSVFSWLNTGIFGYAVPFLLVLTVVVFFHELGHFWVARRVGIKVLTFSVGFGPEIVGFNDRHGTRWKLSAIPLGGYVKFFGDEGEASTPDQKSLATMSESERSVSFHHKSIAARAAVVAAGPIANFLLAIAIFTVLFALFGKPSASARVDVIQANSAAAAAGFRTGDIVRSIDGQVIETFSDMQRVVGTRAGQNLSIVVDRGGAPVTLNATPELREIKDRFNNVHRLGVLGISRNSAPEDAINDPVDPVTALKLGVKAVVDRRGSDADLHRRHSGGTRVSRSGRGTDSHCPDFRAGGDNRFVGLGPPHGRPVDLDRPAEPVPGSAAGWRAPFVLRHRGDQGASAV